MSVTILNFGHPLTDVQLDQVRTLRPGLEIARVVEVPVHFTEEPSYEEQVVALVARTGLTVREWQTLPIIVNPPGFAPVAVMLLAYIHGLRGEFPDLLRIARDEDGGYVVAGVVKLQSLRERGRMARVEGMT